MTLLGHMRKRLKSLVECKFAIHHRGDPVPLDETTVGQGNAIVDPNFSEPRDHENVTVVEARGRDAHPDLARCRLRKFGLCHHKLTFGRTKFVVTHLSGLHQKAKGRLWRTCSDSMSHCPSTR